MLVDFDPQGNASSGLGLEEKDFEQTVYDMMAGEASIKGVHQQKRFRKIWMYFLRI